MIQTTLKELVEFTGGRLINCDEDLTVNGLSIDTRNMKGAQIYCPIVGERFDGHSFIDLAFQEGAIVSLFQKDYDYSMFKSPLILVKDTTKALGDIASGYLKKIGPKVIGVTGSNGKTSTKDMIAAILETKYTVHKTQGNFNNEIGLPQTILAMSPETEVAVLEMGMSGLGEIERLVEIAPVDIAVITSIGSAHLLDLGSMENIVKAKCEITSQFNEDNVLIYNGDVHMLDKYVRTLNLSHTITYGHKAYNDYVISIVTQFIDSLVFTCENLCSGVIESNVLGSFQAQNITAALLVAKELGIEYPEVKEVLNNFNLTGHRNEISQIKEAVIIDDAYKSNPESLKAALDLLNNYQYESKKIAVIGDMLELGENEVHFHQEVSKYIETLDLDRLYTYGPLSKHFHDYTNVIGEHFESKEDLLRSLKPWLIQPTTILFKASHALAFDEFVPALKEEVKKEVKTMKIALMFGGKSSEYFVSLYSAYSALKEFPHDDYDCVLIGISQEGRFFTGDFTPEEIKENKWLENPSCKELVLKPGNDSCFLYLDSLKPLKIDAALNIIHGKYGEDGILPSLLKGSNISITGCDLSSSVICYDKDLTHRLLDLHNITKAKYRTLTKLIKIDEYEEIVAELGQKVCIKPAREGSSYGVSIANNYDEFFNGLEEALKYDSKVLVEEFITGDEIGSAVLEMNGNLVSGVVDQVVTSREIFDYEGKYQSDGVTIHCPALIPQEAMDKANEIGRKVFKLLECRDYARIDFFYTTEGEVYFNEINTIPGFTPTSRFPGMMKGAGVSYQQCIKTLIENALKRAHE